MFGTHEVHHDASYQCDCFVSLSVWEARATPPPAITDVDVMGRRCSLMVKWASGWGSILRDPGQMATPHCALGGEQQRLLPHRVCEDYTDRSWHSAWHIAGAP